MAEVNGITKQLRILDPVCDACRNAIEEQYRELLLIVERRYMFITIQQCRFCHNGTDLAMTEFSYVPPSEKRDTQKELMMLE